MMTEGKGGGSATMVAAHSGGGREGGHWQRLEVVLPSPALRSRDDGEFGDPMVRKRRRRPNRVRDDYPVGDGDNDNDDNVVIFVPTVLLSAMGEGPSSCPPQGSGVVGRKPSTAGQAGDNGVE